ncbi:hypothetical protein G7K_0433-t1 [Saitoella complicata NRRL Y-17804]|uniref:leucine--tRNA ligase n=1 Tax=Saitoella complicata (strain BCRC 22490 / CBS 7301 / JCM 7358 / NBRC 10748 / NRRL Y-17804) TaxID=698492 RepID=A0A0E9N905_SAICN|nr:hypothetical protein G7K_0433-t1 [Saitoella complicata NRRL Y-17804]
MATVDPSVTSAQTLQLAKTAKRDYLVAIEQRYQDLWRQQAVFEQNPPSPEDLAAANLDASSDPDNVREAYPKWFGTMAYPYMNGSLHLGHAFTLTKVEFAAGWERMQGKRALFPLGFHCTGMPIKSAADKIARELEMFGPEFKLPEETDEDLANGTAAVSLNSQPSGNADPTKIVAKKGKQAGKATGLKYQFQIMQLGGVPTSEIHKFADASYWLKYYPPICREDCESFGARVDWRRSMITTDANPYYDSFVQWQMRKLKMLQRIKFGERYTIYSAKDGQPCMDHDRSSGEGVGPQDYTGIKIEVTQWSPAAAEALKSFESELAGKKVFMVAATLRPETMYGQSNCFVGPSITYGLFASNKSDEVFLITRRAANNMAFQGLSPERGVATQLGQIKGDVLVGTKVKAPLSVYEEVYVLPMETVLATKGTGVVTSVPSDSPDDYMTCQDLRKKAEYYKIDPSWASLDAVPIIRTPTYGDLTAPELCKRMKIQSPKDAKLLAEAKEAAYKEGFYQGVMLIGKYAGEKVEKAKPLVRKDLIDASLAFVYNEPEGLVMSRSGDECVVALCDQWYIDYGESTWRAVAERCLGGMNTFAKETRNAFEGVLAWLNQWACARSYGLGTKLPWDPQYLVESLSDSTIYMSYYTIAHQLHSSIDGAKVGPAGVRAEDLNDAVWDYILCRGEKPETSVPIETLDKLRAEFEYFYPLDVRVSGKDLIPNHLTMWIYNHVAIFPERFWPKGVRANGHLLLNGEKMSKSTGNSLTMREAVGKFGADATRIALADAGDAIEDANFEEATANAAVLRLHTLAEWCVEMTKDTTLRTGPKDSLFDRVFENELNALIEVTKEQYDAAYYKNALKWGFYELQSLRDWYREVVAEKGMHKDLVMRFIEVQALLITPVAPHFADFVWMEILENKTTVQNALYPKVSAPVDKTLSATLEYIRGLTSSIHSAEGQQLKKQKKGKQNLAFDPKKPKKLSIFVAAAYPAWQQKYVDLVGEHYDSATNTIDDKALLPKVSKMGEVKKAMAFVQIIKQKLQTRGNVSAEDILSRKQLFSEGEVLSSILGFLEKSVGAKEVEVVVVHETEDGGVKGVKGAEEVEVPVQALSAVPQEPSFVFVNVEA